MTNELFQETCAMVRRACGESAVKCQTSGTQSRAGNSVKNVVIDMGRKQVIVERYSDKDYSYSQLPVNKALTCFEGQNKRMSNNHATTAANRTLHIDEQTTSASKEVLTFPEEQHASHFSTMQAKTFPEEKENA